MARPRQFDTDQALRSAMVVFWTKGYDGASLTDLADAMGIVRPSLQAAFGTKADLYRQVLAAYRREALDFLPAALAAPSVAEVARRYLEGYCVLLSDPHDPAGCLMFKGVLACGNGAAIARQECLAGQQQFESLLGERLRQAQSRGDIAADVDVPTLAASLTTIAAGLAVRADMGASLSDLQSISRTLLRNLF